MTVMGTPAATERKSSNAMSDEEVVNRVRAGEIALFEILMRRYNQRLYRVARAILENDGEAEDVMQEAYVRAYTHLEQFANRAKFSTWLTKIAVHEALARVRHRARFYATNAGAESDAETRGELRSKARDPEEETFDREMKNLLEAAVDSLPENYRSVFMLREIEGMSTTETSECLDITEENVKGRLHRARAMLREKVEARIGAPFTQGFQFAGLRCDRVTAVVLARITPGKRT